MGTDSALDCLLFSLAWTLFSSSLQFLWTPIWQNLRQSQQSNLLWFPRWRQQWRRGPTVWPRNQNYRLQLFISLRTQLIICDSLEKGVVSSGSVVDIAFGSKSTDPSIRISTLPPSPQDSTEMLQISDLQKKTTHPMWGGTPANKIVKRRSAWVEKVVCGAEETWFAVRKPMKNTE